MDSTAGQSAGRIWSITSSTSGNREYLARVENALRIKDGLDTAHHLDLRCIERERQVISPCGANAVFTGQHATQGEGEPVYLLRHLGHQWLPFAQRHVVFQDIDMHVAIAGVAKADNTYAVAGGYVLDAGDGNVHVN